MTKLSTILKQLMSEDNINTSALARKTNILQPVMHRLVTGDTDNPRIDTLLPIAEYFGITVDQLMGKFPLPAERAALSSKNIYTVTVKDSTMSPQFTEGTLLIVDPDLTAENGDFAIIELNSADEPTFKQVFFDGADIYLKPLNPDFKTIHLTKNSTYRFLGVVVESRTTLKKRRTH
jgi:SOS-response transcriptional repressor LexA